MVFKKPYAFMIKHFKLIHLILFALMGYLAIKLNAITNIFSSLAKSQNISTIGLSSKYVTIFMYFFILCVIVIGSFVWFLMRNKKKPRNYYAFLILYYIILFIFLYIVGSALSSIEQTAMTSEALRVYRDISFLIPLGQYYFIVIALLRGIGFNIKQFNFSKDIKDLEISEADSEEIEIGLSNDLYKYGRAGRKKLREFRYYFFENKFLILIILGILFLGGVIYFGMNYRVLSKTYGQNKQVVAGNYMINVQKSYVAEKDFLGNKIRDGYKYIIVGLNVKNNYYENIALDIRLFRLFSGNDFYYPTTSRNSEFQDLGTPYDNKFLTREGDYNYILIYEIAENVSTKNLKLKVYDSIDTKTSKAKYVNINLKPTNIDYTKDNITEVLKQDIRFNNDDFANTTLRINSYKINTIYEYQYSSCISDNCTNKIGVIVPNDNIKNSLLVIDYKLDLDKTSHLYTFVKNDLQFMNKFITLSYDVNGQEKIKNFVGINNSNLKNIMVMEVSKEIERANSIKLIVNTRNSNYIYQLK